jgi:hypothetical protein
MRIVLIGSRTAGPDENPGVIKFEIVCDTIKISKE